MNRRASGVLLPVYALPSPHGIGTLGRAAYDFADFLHAAGQRCWQMLPLGQTGFGDSPYQSFSSFAGNPYFIDLDLLAEDGLLTGDEADACCAGIDPRYVDYGRLYTERFAVLEKAFHRGWLRDREQVECFQRENAAWLSDYADFMALKDRFGSQPWTAWPEPFRRRTGPGYAAAVAACGKEFRERRAFYIYLQYLFFTQWSALRAYLREKNITVIGDLPIYVAPDSCDVWAAPAFFSLDDRCRPTAVAGVPPDYFSPTGQLWGNPLYRWDAMEKDGFGWWLRRIDGAGKLFDVIRFDHFRGLDEYWAVTMGEETAERGQWLPGPGRRLVDVLNSWFPNLRFIAEDLGTPTPGVEKLLQASGWPGMKVLEFAFDDPKSAAYLPHTYTENCVCYTGTHDNSPLARWLTETPEETVRYAAEYMGSPADPAEAMLRLGMSSTAGLFVAQMQDWLGRSDRTNRPGTREGNWRWRMLPGETTPELAKKMHRFAELYGRI